MYCDNHTIQSKSTNRILFIGFLLDLTYIQVSPVAKW